MLRLISDENFNADILRGLFRRRSQLDIVRVQDVGLRTKSDPEILEWAAREGRVLLTHDRATIPEFAYQRVHEGQLMSGVLVVSDVMPLGQAIDEVLLVGECLEPDECAGIVYYIPL